MSAVVIPLRPGIHHRPDMRYLHLRDAIDQAIVHESELNHMLDILRAQEIEIRKRKMDACVERTRVRNKKFDLERELDRLLFQYPDCGE